MDPQNQNNPEIQRLIQLSDESRACLDSTVAAFKHRLNVPSRIRASLENHPAGWLLGSLGCGLAASLIFRRRPSMAKKRHGFPNILLGLALTAARPMAKVWLANQAKQWLARLATNRLQACSLPLSKSR